MEKKPINHEWDEYYKYLFELQDSGRTNMWGAGVYIVNETDIHDYGLAKRILFSWMDNWDELKEYFNNLVPALCNRCIYKNENICRCNDFTIAEKVSKCNYFISEQEGVAILKSKYAKEYLNGEER